MNPDHARLMSKFIDRKCALTIVMLVQAMTAAELAFTQYTTMYENKKADPFAKAMQMLAYARFFSEACGWCALAIRRLRDERTPEIKAFLENNIRHTDNLYNLRNAVNHHYNEDVSDEYRKNNYKKGRHQANLAFNFSSCPDGISFRIGTIEINMISQLASMKKLENELLAMK